MQALSENISKRSEIASINFERSLRNIAAKKAHDDAIVNGILKGVEAFTSFASGTGIQEVGSKSGTGPSSGSVGTGAGLPPSASKAKAGPSSDASKTGTGPKSSITQDITMPEGFETSVPETNAEPATIGDIKPVFGRDAPTIQLGDVELTGLPPDLEDVFFKDLRPAMRTGPADINRPPVKIDSITADSPQSKLLDQWAKEIRQQEEAKRAKKPKKLTAKQSSDVKKINNKVKKGNFKKVFKGTSLEGKSMEQQMKEMIELNPSLAEYLVDVVTAENVDRKFPHLKMTEVIKKYKPAPWSR